MQDSIARQLYVCQKIEGKYITKPAFHLSSILKSIKSCKILKAAVTVLLFPVLISYLVPVLCLCTCTYHTVSVLVYNPSRPILVSSLKVPDKLSILRITHSIFLGELLYMIGWCACLPTQKFVSAIVVSVSQSVIHTSTFIGCVAFKQLLICWLERCACVCSTMPHAAFSKCKADLFKRQSFFFFFVRIARRGTETKSGKRWPTGKSMCRPQRSLF